MIIMYITLMSHSVITIGHQLQRKEKNKVLIEGSICLVSPLACFLTVKLRLS